MKGRSRGYALTAGNRPGKSAISVVFNDRCDMIVATAVLPHDRPADDRAQSDGVSQQHKRVALGGDSPRDIAFDWLGSGHVPPESLPPTSVRVSRCSAWTAESGSVPIARITARWQLLHLNERTCQQPRPSYAADGLAF